MHSRPSLLDAETGLVYLRARYYDPGTGQFLTVDPLFDVTRERYGYVGGDPLNGSDPSGLLLGIDNLIAGGVGGVGGFLGSIGSQLIGTGTVNWTKVGISSAAGAAAGAAFATCGWCAGAAAGFVNDAATQLYEKKTLDWRTINRGELAAATISSGAFGSIFDLPIQLDKAMGVATSRTAARLWSIFAGTGGAGAGLLTGLYAIPNPYRDFGC